MSKLMSKGLACYIYDPSCGAFVPTPLIKEAVLTFTSYKGCF